LGASLGKAPSDRPALKPYWGKPAVGILGEAMETSASLEARSAPLPYPTTGMKERLKESHEKGVAIRSASSLARVLS